MDIQELAAYANTFFERKQRPEDEDHYYVVADYRPTWVKEMAHAANGEMLPDDYRYQYVVDTLTALENGDNPDEPDLQADDYKTERTRWLASNLLRLSYVDEAVAELGGSSGEIIEDIALGQIFEKREVWGVVVNALQERLESIEAEEEEEFEGKRPVDPRKRWSPKEDR